MDASTAKEFGEERVREVAALVEEIKQHIAFMDEWRLAQEDVPNFFSIHRELVWKILFTCSKSPLRCVPGRSLKLFSGRHALELTFRYFYELSLTIRCV